MKQARTARCLLAALLCCLTWLASCRRSDYRQSADADVRRIIDERSTDPRWAFPEFTIDVDQRSRYFDGSDPDYPPMPPDDPAARELMPHIESETPPAEEATAEGVVTPPTAQDAEWLENPEWRESWAEGLPRTPDGRAKIRLEDAVRLALRHSPSYQQQLESLYLSALDVSTERFRFEVQFFGSVAPRVQHQGSLTPGGESNTVAMDSDAALRKTFSTAGELLVNFANTIGWEFFGPNDGFTMSRIGLTFVQPLLRGGGQVVALEQLTIAERTLLSNLRAFQLYRQGFYLQVSVGESGLSSVQRRGGFFGGTGLTGFTGQGSGGFGGVGDVTGFGRGGLGGGGGGAAGGGAGFAGGGAGTVGGFIGLLQQTQQIRNTRDSLNLQLRTLALLEANLEAGLIDIAQVDQFRQNIETERASLLQAQNALEASLDTFNRSTLGLPPDLPIEPDDSLIQPFQLIDPTMTAAQSGITEYIREFGELPPQPSVEQLRQAFDRIQALRQSVESLLDRMPAELSELEKKAAPRRQQLTETERKLFDQDFRRQEEDLQQMRTRFNGTAQDLAELRAGLAPDTVVKSADGVVELLTELESIVGEMSLVQARGRLETIAVDPIHLSSKEALEIARGARLDWMNNRAALVDTWRLIEFNANALESGLTLRFNADFPTVGDSNPVKFRKEAATLRAGVEFDGPFTRLVERNNFRQQLISYQQDRRQLIQFEDGVHQSLRQTLRNLEQLRVNLEIQRRAVAIAIRRVDQTREALQRPVPPTQPGQPQQPLGPTAAQNLLFALSDLRTTQNNLMSVWLNYLSERMQLYRDLGVLRVDDQGLWIDEPLDQAIRVVASAALLPPAVPKSWLEGGEAVLATTTGAPDDSPSASDQPAPSTSSSEAHHEPR